VADFVNQIISMITPGGAVETLAGRAGQIGTAGGIGSDARFWGSSGVAVDSAGSLYVADYNNHRITKGTLLLRFGKDPGNLTISNGVLQVRSNDPKIRELFPRHGTAELYEKIRRICG